MRSLLIYVSPRCRCQVSVRTYICFALLRCSALRQGYLPCLLWRLLTSHSSLLLRLMGPPVRPHGISRQSFLVYLPDLRLRVTVAFLDFTAFSQLIRRKRLISGFCSSGYDFAIPSSRLHLAMQTLGVALGFVGNYAPCGLSPQTDGMPVIQKNGLPLLTGRILTLPHSLFGHAAGKVLVVTTPGD